MSAHERITLSVCLIATTMAASLGRAAPAADACSDARTQGEIETCISEEMERTDRDLDRAYADYLSSLVGADRERLVQAQRAWKEYRDRDCQAAYGMYAGGTMAGTAYLACKTRLTNQRLEELKRIYENPSPAAVGLPKKDSGDNPTGDLRGDVGAGSSETTNGTTGTNVP